MHLPLQRIVIQYDLPESREALLFLMDSNATIRQIDIPAQEHEAYELIETIGRRWHGGTNPLEVMIYEQGLERVGRNLVTVVMEKAPKDPTDLEIFPETNNTTIDIMKWECSYVSRALEDRHAKILKTLTQAHPTDIESFTLKSSLLTERGLASVQSVLRQSDLDYLNIECAEFDTSKRIHLGQVLGTMNWSTIKSLKLHGDNIDSWMKLWAEHCNLTDLLFGDHRLLRVDIIGSGVPKQELAHSSAVWLHNVIYLLSPIEIHMVNIQMKEIRDWELIRDASDGPTPERFSLVNCNVAQSA